MAYNRIRLISRALSASTLAISASFIAMAASQSGFAQENNGQLQDIVVTAQKREESLQNIPVAVTALNRASLENLQVSNFNNLSGLAPNVTSVTSTSGSNPQVTIRGIIGGNVELGKDSGVALYLDGVYVGRSTGAGFDVADLERVEVLRGPQGTLYGRNATGGAVNYITQAPKGELYWRQDVSVGNLGLLRTRTRIDLPKFGPFSISGNFLHDERDGWVRNTASGLVYDLSDATAGTPYPVGRRTSVKRLGSRNVEAGQIAVRFAPEGAPIVVDYKFDRTHAQYTNRGNQVLVDNSGLDSFRSLAPTFVYQDRLPMGFTTPENLDTWGHNLTITLDLSDAIQFKSITGYRGYKTEFSNDVIGGGFENSLLAPPGGGTFDVLGIIETERDRSFSQEAQLTYDSDLVNLIGGVFYYRQHTKTVNPLYFFAQLPTADVGPVPASGFPSDGDILNKSIAGYGQATIHATEQLDVTAGVRYTHDERNKDSVLNPDPANAFQAKFNHVDWMANVNYRPNNDMTFYAKAGTGYISGGINTALPIAYQPEKLFQVELGAKTDWFDRRLRANIALFHSTYKNLQQSVNDANGFFITDNVGKATIKGLELELTALPVKNLTLSANYGYSKFKYKEFILGVIPGTTTPNDVTDIAYPNFYRPKHTITLNAQYDLPEIGNGMKPSFNVNARWHSDMALYVQPAVFAQTQLNPALTPAQLASLAAVDKFTQDNAIWEIDARASLAAIPLDTAKGKVSVWVRNLLDKNTITNATSVASFGIVSGQFHEPRTYGVDFSIEF